MKTRTESELRGNAMSWIGSLRGTIAGRFPDQFQEYCSSLSRDRLGYGALAFWTLAGSLAFHLAFALPQLAFLVVFYVFAIMQMGRAETWRGAFYSGLAWACSQELPAARCPGDGAEITGILHMGTAGRFPVDHWLAPACVALTAICGCGLTCVALREKVRQNRAIVNG